MSVGRAPNNPSPLAGEDAARSAAGEGLSGEVILGGVGSRGPSPGRSLRSRPTSPARGEGKGGRGSSAKPEIRHRARVLRINMTNAERKLWYALRDRRFAGFRFRRQVPLGAFIADFVCFERRLMIEVDGGQRSDSVQDRYRDRWLAANEFRVVRFWSNQVLSNIESVTTVLAQILGVEWS
jgi:very-short-patch-repair endonuclease